MLFRKKHWQKKMLFRKKHWSKNKKNKVFLILLFFTKKSIFRLTLLHILVGHIRVVNQVLELKFDFPKP
jgi:hypothetical protein